MKTNFDKSLITTLATGACIVIFTMLLFIVASSFRSSIKEIVEYETRVTVINRDGSVFYDTDSAAGNHASRDEVRKAFAKGHSSSLRHSETLDRDFLYSARRVGNHVVRLAVPYTGVLKSERLAWAGLSAALAAGICIMLLVFFITRRLTQKMNEQSKRLEVATANEAFRSEFTSNVTHELKSPLTAVKGAVGILEDDTKLSKEDRNELFKIINKESDRLNSLINDILSLSQIEQEKIECSKDFTVFALNEVINNIVKQDQTKTAAAHIQIVITRNDNVFIYGNPCKIEEVLQNLLDNAIRYSGSTHIEISSIASDKTVAVSVRDFGIGIAAEHLPHIFERFYRVNKSRSRSLGGTGLGLAIVKHLVQLHNGSVSVSSTPGSHTVFTFELPLSVPPQNK